MTKRYRLVESDTNNVSPEIANTSVNVNWTEVETVIGASISPAVRSRYEAAFSGRSFKILQLLKILSRFGDVAHILFITKAIFGTLSETGFLVWAVIFSIQCINYLYKEWFVARNHLDDVAIDTYNNDVVVTEGDLFQKVNVSKAKDKLSNLWKSIWSDESSPKWKWLLAVVLIMVAALLGKYIYSSGAVIESQYIKQYKRIRSLAEQDSQQQQNNQQQNNQQQNNQQQNTANEGNAQEPKAMPEPEQLFKMSPEESQKAIQEFIKANNITNAKQFTVMFKNAAHADVQRNHHLVETLKAKNPAEFQRAVQIAYAPVQKQGFFDVATMRFKSSFSAGSIASSILFTCLSGGGFTGLLTYSLPNLLAGGLGPFAGMAFMIAKMCSGKEGIIGTGAGLLAKGIYAVSAGLACCCIIRWLYKYFTNPKRAGKPTINKAELSKQLGGDAIRRNAPKQNMQSESYFYETMLYLDEGIISYVKSKVVGFIKGTWNCLKALLGNKSVHGCIKLILGVLTIGFMLAVGCFSLTSATAG